MSKMFVLYLLVIGGFFFAEGDFNHIAGLTMQDLAQFVQCFHGNIFVMPDITHRVTADIVVIDQAVSSNTALFQCAPQGIVIVHNHFSFVLIFCFVPVQDGFIPFYIRKQKICR